MSFQKITKSLAKELAPRGDLVPVCSSRDHDKYRLFSLLYKKKKISWWKTESFHTTEYKLTDVVCSGGHAVKLDVPDVKEGDNFTFKIEVDGTVGGQISGCDIAAIEANVSMSYARSLKVKKIELCPAIINSVKKLKINRDHEFIKQSQKHNYDLYIVTEVVETLEDAQIEESSQRKGTIFYEDYLKMRLKGTRDSEKTILIPKSCILAFRTQKLKVLKESLGLSYYSDDRIGTWQFADSDILVWKHDCLLDIFKSPDETTLPESVQSFLKHSLTTLPNYLGLLFSKASLSLTETEFEIYDCLPVVYHNKKSIQQEVDMECAQFSSLSANRRGVFLTGFVAVMRNNDLLEQLELQLEDALLTPGQCKRMVKKPELQDLLENLQDRSGVIIPELAKAVVYFLKALEKLEDQFTLLEESVEKKIVPKQLALIERFLDYIRGDREVKFIVDAQILSKEEIIITRSMIEMSGVTIEETEPHLTGRGQPAAFVPLYVALYVLNLLTKQ